MRKNYFYCIEGINGAGKSLLGCALAVNYRTTYHANIFSNIRFRGIEYTHLRYRKELFEATNGLVILDEAQDLAWFDDSLSGKEVYKQLLANARKKNITVIFITQQVGLMQRKIRNMLQHICFPIITAQSDIVQEVEYDGEKYITSLTKESCIVYQWYKYYESFATLFSKWNNIVPTSPKERIQDVFQYFKYYDTYQRDYELLDEEKED